MSLRTVDLFTGIGGIPLALHEACTPVLYCEVEPFPQSVLRRRMDTGDLPKAPIADDIRTFSVRPGTVDLVAGGFPCQGVSTLGNRTGIEHCQTGLFDEMLRLIKDARPTFAFFENVFALTMPYMAPLLTHVLQSLVDAGYDVVWTTVKAAQVGAGVQRNRWFALARLRGSDALPPPVSFAPLERPEPSPRMVPWPRGSIHKKRCMTLGNAVCPAQCKLAWNTLGEALATPNPAEVTYVTLGTDVTARRTNSGIRDASMVRDFKLRFEPELPPEVRAHPDFGKNAARQKQVLETKGMCMSQGFDSVTTGTHWPAPRKGSWYPAERLTFRTRRDVQACMRFEASTPLQERMPGTRPNPEFVEWLMGFPAGWTHP
jgi:site-specific DNA-cytosine methylase